MVTPIHTERLTLRGWRDSDREPFAALNDDAETMRYFPATLDREASDAFADRVQAHLEEFDWGLWAVDLDGEFLGYTGLATPGFEAPFMPATEIGWRFRRKFWGNGYATEAARAVVEAGFGRLGLDEIVSFTTVTNVPSRRVMERLGMTHDAAEDFEHPRVPDGHPLRPHVLYRLRRPH
jgi:RimJ/RimL family protein N-acetyltransferase